MLLSTDNTHKVEQPINKTVFFSNMVNVKTRLSTVL